MESLARKENTMLTIMSFIKKHSVLTYYALAFAISWGSFIVVIGPGEFLGTKEVSEGQMLFLLLTMLLGPSLAGILSTAFIYGSTGLRELLSRLLRWRVAARWYAVALLTAPLIYTAVTLVLLQTSRDFLPIILTSDNKVSLLLSSIVSGIIVAVFEELGWTGFVTPRLRRRYGILTTGLVIGLLWGAWHFPLFSGSVFSSQTIPPTLYLAVLLFSWLLPYRVLIVWVYDHTGSLLVAMLMHLPIVVAQFVRLAPATSEVQVVIDNLVLAAAMWVIVAAMLRFQTLPRQARGALSG
jgi:uncharacterized protein